MTPRRRRLALWLIALTLGVVAADTAVWVVAERRLARGLAAAEADAASSGYRVDQAATHWRGWPVAATLTLERPSVASGGVAWAADRVDLTLAPWAPRRLTIGVIGDQSIAVLGNTRLRGVAEAMTVTVPLVQDPAVPAATIAVRTLRLWQGAAADATVVGSLSGHIDGLDPDGGLRLDASATDIMLPADVHAALGPRIDLASVSGSLLKAVASGPTAPGASLAAQATAWRDRGGTADVRHFVITWDQLHATGSARVALDRDLQPALSGTADIDGLDPTLARLAAAGAVPEREALAARAVLSLIAAPAGTPAPTGPSADAPAGTTLRFGVSGRVLTIEGLPVLRLPPLVWSQS